MSGQSVGGIIGGAIGSIWGPMGAQIGFAIGSMVGGYVDPVKVKGPRLTDATTQASTVGGVIPFGYGTFVTAGNVIWCGDLKEHKKTQRQGKGGGAKTTTYTYTRSYAVGVCQGAIYGFRWIKRNGKKVYTTDPNATAEERAYSAKWLQKCTLYIGTETQMPDSTIVAREGVGNVSAFRGLAYIVVENDDLTDLSGAIPQYEFCINATPPEAYLTSHPYPQIFTSRSSTSLAVQYGVLDTVLLDSLVQPDSVTTSVSVDGGALYTVEQPQIKPDRSQVSIAVIQGALKQPPLGSITPDKYSTSLAVSAGVLKAAPIGNFKDKTTATISVDQGSLYVP